MKTSIISLVVGLTWLLTPQVIVAQGQDQLIEKAKSLSKQPSTELLYETQELLKSNAKTSDMQKMVKELDSVVSYVDNISFLIQIGNKNGKLKDDEKVRTANKVFEEIVRLSRTDMSNPHIYRRYNSLSSFRYNKEIIEKDLQKNKINQEFVPYMIKFSNILMEDIGERIVTKLEEQNKNAQNIEYLKKYYASLGKTNSKGIIPVEKTKRDYTGDIPFRDYYKTFHYDMSISTFLDEKFVLDKELWEDKLTQLKAVKQRKRHYDRIKDLLSTLPTDTFGLYADEWQDESGFVRKGEAFINLRTGRVFKLDEFGLNNILESTTYLAKYASVPDFKYDPSYSLSELFDYEYYYPEFPEKMCKALEGVEVYNLNINDYDVITSVRVQKGNFWNGRHKLTYDVEFKKGKVQSGIKGVGSFFSIKWYEKLKEYIGKKVIYCDKSEERLLYNDFISSFDKWTLESVELGTLGEGYSRKAALVATIRNGQQTKRLDAVSDCQFLTREDLDLYPKDLRFLKHVLSYDYVNEHAINMPENKKRELSLYAKNYTASLVQSFREIWVGQSISLFLSDFPKAKLVKNAVSGGKVIKIYHVDGQEFVFKDNICTSVTKI